METNENIVIGNDTNEKKATKKRVATKTIKSTPVVEKTESAPKKVVEAKKYKPDDLILCRSVTQGELLYSSSKTGELYVWSAIGDIKEVQYQDLYSLKSSRSRYIYEPFFMIEDEDLLNDPRWADVKAVYDKMYSRGDVIKVINLPNDQFESVLKSLPSGFRSAVMFEVATQIERGTFDSIKKVSIIDDVCGTDLKSTIV